jgi:predicted dehydrogenase
MQLNRRAALKSISSVAFTSLVPRSVWAAPDSTLEKLRIAAVGIGGRGKADLDAMRDHSAFQLAAVCDVDRTFFPMADEFGSDVQKFQDYRQMFAKSGDAFDAVLIATPDHMHSPIAMLAMENGKHVYLQKPLAQDISECRMLAEVAGGKPELATQMGIQIHAHAAYRTAVQWIQSGLIGNISEVHSWSGKGWGGEPEPKQPSKAPESLDWDLYLGVARYREYVEGWYHRNNWRKWMAFGTGTQGDMGCHILDPVFNSLGLTTPIEVVSQGPRPFKENFALISHIEYLFQGTELTTDPLKLSWYNGSLRPQKLAALPDSIQLPDQGSIFVGEVGSLILPHIGQPQVYQTDGKPVAKLPQKQSHGNHFHDWIDCAVGKTEKTLAPFSYAGPLTEAVLLGTVINRWPGLRFNWDARNCKFAGDSAEITEANSLLKPPYRSGW